MKREVSVRDFSEAPEYFTSMREVEKSFLLVIKDACTTNSLGSVANVSCHHVHANYNDQGRGKPKT